MHRLIASDNQAGSFQKLAVDLDAQVFEQMKLLFVDKTRLVESLLDPSFVHGLKNLCK